MKHQLQVRTILLSGRWSEWTGIGDPMTDLDRRQFLYMHPRILRSIPAEFRFIEVKDDSPSVFKR